MSRVNKSVPQVVSDIYWDSTLAVKAITAGLYLFGSGGLCLRGIKGAGDDADLALLFSHLSPFYWAWFLLIISCSRVIGLFYHTGNIVTRLLVPMLGLTVWCLLFAASILDTDHFGMGLLYLSAAQIEAWILARVITEEVFKKKDPT